MIKHLTGGIGVDRVIDAVGVDAERATSGPAADRGAEMSESFDAERSQVAPEVSPRGDNWHPGDAPSQALVWAVQLVAKAGTVGVIGVYPPTAQSLPIGLAMNKNLTVNMGNCNHRRYVHELVDIVASGQMGLAANVTQAEPMTDVTAAYEALDRREPGWVKVKIEPSSVR